MCEGVGHDIALRAPLQSIVADGRSRLQGRLDVAGFDEAPLLLGVMTPNSGKAISLQLDPDLKLISFSFVHAALKRLHTGQDPEQVLHMVANFMCDDVRLRELATL